MRKTTTGLILMLAAGASVTGCARSAAFTERAPYPESLTVLPPSNIQLYRQGRTITLSNTTARPFGASTIWLNKWFSRDIKSLAIGESMTLTLGEFTDEYGDAFKGGGFFATTAPERIVHAELETQEDAQRVLVPLIVVGQREY